MELNTTLSLTNCAELLINVGLPVMVLNATEPADTPVNPLPSPSNLPNEAVAVLPA